MKEIAIIIPYFGRFKPSIMLWMESVRRNPEIDWYVFSDNSPLADLPRNVYWTMTSLKEISKLAERKLNINLRIERPYKLCDFKPFYGLIFSDYITQYDYWGFGDVDLVYGRLFEFLKNIEFRKYDLVNRFGHFCIIKNTDRMNKIAFSDIAKRHTDISVILSKNNNFWFDEKGFIEICALSNVKMYNGLFSADIDGSYERMRCIDKKTLTRGSRYEHIGIVPKNYKKQIFLVCKGKVLRVYIKNYQLRFNEYAYIHFNREVPIEFENFKLDSYIISRYGFYSFDAQRINDYSFIKECIYKYNNQSSWIAEALYLNPMEKVLKNIYANSQILKRIWKKIKF